MFMGHYGVSFAAKPADRRLPLWLLFIAVQWLDIWWAMLVMLGVEKFRIAPHFTEAMSLDFYYMPYSHSLAGALVLSILLGALSAAFLKPRLRTFLIIAAAAFSHWLLDLVVHVPDLPLIGNSDKVGFGLWRHLWISFPLELVVLWGGAFIYAHYVKAASAFHAAWLWIFVAAMTFEEVNVSFGLFGPFFPTPAAIAGLSLSIYLLIALLAALVDRTRRTNLPQPA
jgi:hypothetical protein